jgi:hypothetical protein
VAEEDGHEHRGAFAPARLRDVDLADAAHAWSLSHQVASIPAMITCMLFGSNWTSFSSWMCARMKSRRADPDFFLMSCFSVAIEASLRAISSVTMAGSVSIAACPPPGGAHAGPSFGSDGMKSPRSRTVSSASRMSGSDFPRAPRRLARLSFEASI